MTLAKTQVIRFSPLGLSDSLDETDEFPGACTVLQNLIPDPSTKNVWTVRPASLFETAFAGYSSPGYVSIFKVIGRFVYGLVASGRNSGKDEPFCFDLIAQTFITVQNILSTNVPASPLTVGDWVPATMDVVGSRLIVTHPGFTGTNGYFGWFDLADLVYPVWNSGNLNVNGSIQAVGSIAGGSLYVSGIYQNVTLTGGTGSGAKAVIVIVANTVAKVFITAPGSGYVAGDVLSATTASLGGLGSGFSFTVAQVALYGSIQFTTAPSWVAQFYQRAYFGINPVFTSGPVVQGGVWDTAKWDVAQWGGVNSPQVPSVVFTDVLYLNCTNANQALTFGNTLTLIAGKGLGLSNQLGGIIQSLMVFQDDANIIQITGDSALSTLSVNSLNVACGTKSPRSIVSTPHGLMFLDVSGYRIIDQNANVSPPLGQSGKGVVTPLIYGATPSRINAACNGSVLRVSLTRGDIAGNPWQEFWYDLNREVWSGPHTFPSTMIDVYDGQFIVAPQSQVGELYSSDVVPSLTSVFRENGNLLNWVFQTVVFADNMEQAVSETMEMTVKAGISAGANQFTVTWLDANGNALPNGTKTRVINPSGTGSYWQGPTALWPYRIDFPGPLIYVRAAVQITGPACSNFRLGDLFYRRRALGYVDNIPDDPGSVGIPCYVPAQSSTIIIMDDCCHVYVSNAPFTTWTETTSPTDTIFDGWTDMVMAINDGDYTAILPVDFDVSASYNPPVFNNGQAGVCLCTPTTFPSAPIVDPGNGSTYQATSAAITAVSGSHTILVPLQSSSQGYVGDYYPRISRDGGVTWADVTGLSNTHSWINAAFSASASVMYCQQYTGKLWQSLDNGTTWAVLSNSPTLPSGAGNGENSVRLRCSADGTVVVISYVSVAAGPNYSPHIAVSTDGGVTWNDTNLRTLAGGQACVFADFGMATDGSVLLAVVGYHSSTGGQGWVSTNHGTSWTSVTLPTAGSQTPVVCNVTPDGSKMVVVYDTPGAANGNADYSLNGGTSWTATTFVLAPLGVGSTVGTMVSCYMFTSGTGVKWDAGVFDATQFS